jgi:hypothetical protein
MTVFLDERSLADSRHSGEFGVAHSVFRQPVLEDHGLPYLVQIRVVNPLVSAPCLPTGYTPRVTSPGTYLDRLMTELGIENHQLAKQADAERQAIHKLRRGITRMLPHWAKRLAPHLGVTWQELVEGAPADPDEARLLAAYRALDKDRKQGLLTVAEGMVPVGRLQAPPPPAPRTQSKGPEPPSRPFQEGGRVKEKRVSWPALKVVPSPPSCAVMEGERR